MSSIKPNREAGERIAMYRQSTQYLQRRANVFSKSQVTLAACVAFTCLGHVGCATLKRVENLPNDPNVNKAIEAAKQVKALMPGTPSPSFPPLNADSTASTPESPQDTESQPQQEPDPSQSPLEPGQSTPALRVVPSLECDDVNGRNGYPMNLRVRVFSRDDTPLDSVPVTFQVVGRGWSEMIGVSRTNSDGVAEIQYVPNINFGRSTRTKHITVRVVAKRTSRTERVVGTGDLYVSP